MIYLVNYLGRLGMMEPMAATNTGLMPIVLTMVLMTTMAKGLQMKNAVPVVVVTPMGAHKVSIVKFYHC